MKLGADNKLHGTRQENLLIDGALRARVQKGMAWLDEQYDLQGWENRIALKRLVLKNCERCVLGQLYGGYMSVVTVREQLPENRRLTDGQACDLGFNIATGRFAPGDSELERAAGLIGYDLMSEGYHAGFTDYLYARLSHVWREAIRARLEQP